jgi:hypothetical protein
MDGVFTQSAARNDTKQSDILNEVRDLDDDLVSHQRIVIEAVS